MNYHRVIAFDNGYSASVICHGGSYGHESGLFEVAVIGPDGQLDYTTPVTSDVIGHLDFHGVAEVLDKIKALPPVMDASFRKTQRVRLAGPKS